MPTVSLANRLDRLARSLVTRVQEVVQTVAIEIGDEVVSRTPVLTGYARGNWRPSVNEPERRPVSVLDPTGAQTIARIRTVARTSRPGDEVIISNNIDYIAALNAGHSPQAPAGYIETAVRVGTERGVAKFSRGVFQAEV